MQDVEVLPQLVTGHPADLLFRLGAAASCICAHQLSNDRLTRLLSQAARLFSGIQAPIHVDIAETQSLMCMTPLQIFVAP